jgi:hypothetical protein
VAKRWRDGEPRMATSGYPITPMVARKLAHGGGRDRVATIRGDLPPIQSRPGLTATGATDGGCEGAPVATTPVFVFIFTCWTSS